MNAEPAIQLRQATITYPGSTFRMTIDRFELARQEQVACIGPSGSGKTRVITTRIARLLGEKGGSPLLPP